ncbi:phage portal protein [Latilactobacillus curvatus]|uniref:Phage portal protein n=2 Tax=Latilactobacillus curvatus TaxID=28038 RepID=A0AAC9Y086_LATCU|nr:phage portal protein [Latilactobacillus curvatus]
MAMEVNIPGLGNDLLDMVRITDNGEFTFPASEEITSGDLLNAVDYHRNHLRPKYEKEYQYYRGKHDILSAAPKAEYKPDNRIVFNFPKKAVTTFNGFFIGNPVKVDHDDDTVDEFVEKWDALSNFEDVSSEVSKQSSMYGHSYFFVYQSEETDSNQYSHPKVAAVSPMNAFLIYDDSFEHKARYGVMYRYNYKHELEITLFDKSFKRELISSSLSNDYLDQARVTANPYPLVPLIEVTENNERMALCEDIITIIDALNKAMSEKANDNDYFADAMLKIVNARINPEDMKKMRENRLINATGEAAGKSEIGYLAKPDADATQEHLIDRLASSIYEMSNITNLNDESFSGNPSGVSLRLKYQAMENMARTKSLKFTTALRQVFRCVFSVSYNEVNANGWEDLQFKYTQSIPENLLEEAQAASALYGKISNRTLFKQLRFIDDPDAELEQIKKEQQETQGMASDMLQKSLTDQQKAGVTDDNRTTGKSTDTPTH